MGSEMCIRDRCRGIGHRSSPLASTPAYSSLDPAYVFPSHSTSDVASARRLVRNVVVAADPADVDADDATVDDTSCRFRWDRSRSPLVSRSRSRSRRPGPVVIRLLVPTARDDEDEDEEDERDDDENDDDRDAPTPTRDHDSHDRVTHRIHRSIVLRILSRVLA